MVSGSGFRVSGFGLKSRWFVAVAVPAGDGVGAVRVRVAVVCALDTLVRRTIGAIADPPATEQSRPSQHNHATPIRLFGRGVSDPRPGREKQLLPLQGLLATTCAENQRALLTKRGWVRPGSRPSLGLLFKGNSKTVPEGVPCFRLWLRVEGFDARSVCKVCRGGILYSLEGGPTSRDSGFSLEGGQASRDSGFRDSGFGFGNLGFGFRVQGSNDPGSSQWQVKLPRVSRHSACAWQLSVSR